MGGLHEKMKIIQSFITKNECFIIGRNMAPKGVLVHSTGVPNVNLRRYVPNDKNGLIGENQNNNTWNQFRPDGRQVAVHAWIGRLIDGTIATAQTLPWDMRGWHAGGIANDTHIGFEICEDGLIDRAYFDSVYKEAMEFCAFLCKQFSLDPMKDGVVICHSEGAARGIASNHADVMHWFPRHGKNMNMFRSDVQAEINRSRDGGKKLEQSEFNKMMDIYLTEQAKKNTSEWVDLEGSWKKAVAKKIFDGTSPQSALTREMAAAVIDRLGLI